MIKVTIKFRPEGGRLSAYYVLVYDPETHQIQSAELKKPLSSEKYSEMLYFIQNLITQFGAVPPPDYTDGVFIAKFEQKISLDTHGLIAVWNRLYLANTGVAYGAIPPREIKMLAQSAAWIDESLIVAFFSCNEWFAKTKTITTLVKYAKEVKALTDKPTAQQPNNKYPDYYDKKFEANCKSSELSEYWRHLRSIGWKVVKVEGKNVWQKGGSHA